MIYELNFIYFRFRLSFNLVKKGSRRRDAELGTRETIERTNFARVCPFHVLISDEKVVFARKYLNKRTNTSEIRTIKKTNDKEYD